MYDVAIVGGGVVGLATAISIQTKIKNSKVILFEKEKVTGYHQTGHNSGVIHAGIYYEPGTLKAKLCRDGLVRTKNFCSENNIPFIECGKLIVATNQLELERLNDLFNRSDQNGIQLERVTKSALINIEPNIKGMEALLAKETSIVDYKQICSAMANMFFNNGGEILFSSEVEDITEHDSHVVISSNGNRFKSKSLIACAGLQSDRIACMAGLNPNFKIIPFRGEYYVLSRNYNQKFSHLIYPVPDPSMPFLGIHITKMIDGSVTVGPNAVIGFSREGYHRFSFEMKDFFDTVKFAGFWKLIKNNRRHALNEFQNSIFKYKYLEECRKYCPMLSINDLKPHRAGIGAQAVLSDGTPVHDFHFMRTERMLHVCNAPSPAATSAIPIGEMIVDEFINFAN